MNIYNCEAMFIYHQKIGWIVYSIPIFSETILFSSNRNSDLIIIPAIIMLIAIQANYSYIRVLIIFISALDITEAIFAVHSEKIL